LLAVFVVVLRLFGGAGVELVNDSGFDAREAFEPPGDVDELVDEVLRREEPGSADSWKPNTLVLGYPDPLN